MSLLKIVPDQGNSLYIVLLLEGEIWKRIYKSLFFNSLHHLLSLSTVSEVKRSFSILEDKIAKAYVMRCLGKKAFLKSERSEERRVGKEC